MEKKFRKGEIVWAKVRGFPWWPAIVRSLNFSTRREEEGNPEREITAVVYFVGDDSHSELPLNKIEKFQQKLEEYSKTKKKTLLTSIHIAKKILSGEIPFEKHLHYAKKKNIDNKEEESNFKEKEVINEKSDLKVLGKKRRLTRKEGDNDTSKASNMSNASNSSNSNSKSSTPEKSIRNISFNNSITARPNFINSNINTTNTTPSTNYNKTIPLGGVKANITKTSNFNSNITTNNSCPNSSNINSNNGNKVNTHHQIDFRVKDDLSKNIKINININVNNNTNNTLNITTFGRNSKKIIDDFEDEIYAEGGDSININTGDFITCNNLNKAETAANFNADNGGSSIATNSVEKAAKANNISNIEDSSASNVSSDDEDSDENDDDSEMADELNTSKQELKEAIDSLLFYKIDMPATSSNRSIISSLNLIEETLPKLKNCGIYTVNKNLIIEFLAD
jgi:hypothetical protein